MLRQAIETGTLDGVVYSIEVDGNIYNTSRVKSIKPSSIRISYTSDDSERPIPVYKHESFVLRLHHPEGYVVEKIRVLSSRVLRHTTKCYLTNVDVEHIEIFEALVVG